MTIARSDRTPLPAMYSRNASLMPEYFDGKSSQEVYSGLPTGIVIRGEQRVRSDVIDVPGHEGRIIINGRIDNALAFDEGGYGLLDYKTSKPKSDNIRLYGRQLQSYTLALENPAADQLTLAPIIRLGLVYVDLDLVSRDSDGRISYEGDVTWVEHIRDDEGFMEFLGDVLDVIERREPPDPSPSCDFCTYEVKRWRTGV